MAVADGVPAALTGGSLGDDPLEPSGDASDACAGGVGVGEVRFVLGLAAGWAFAFGAGLAVGRGVGLGVGCGVGGGGAAYTRTNGGFTAVNVTIREPSPVPLAAVNA
jgi:hypothetical protein